MVLSGIDSAEFSNAPVILSIGMSSSPRIFPVLALILCIVFTPASYPPCGLSACFIAWNVGLSASSLSALARASYH